MTDDEYGKLSNLLLVLNFLLTMFSKIHMINTCRYGFYGDVIAESEKYRWMGPKRYDYAGTRVFLKHK